MSHKNQGLSNFNHLAFWKFRYRAVRVTFSLISPLGISWKSISSLAPRWQGGFDAERPLSPLELSERLRTQYFGAWMRGWVARWQSNLMQPSYSFLCLDSHLGLGKLGKAKSKASGEVPCRGAQYARIVSTSSLPGHYDTFPVWRRRHADSKALVLATGIDCHREWLQW